MFGRNVGEGVGVSETQWARFVDREIASRFPDGVTVLDGVGQWPDRTTGKVVHEPSKMVHIVLRGKADDLARLDEVVAAYKRRFRQHSVGMILRPACVSF